MIELHGWLTIIDTYADEELLSEDEINQIWQKVKTILVHNTCGLKIQFANGMPFLHTLLCTNHRTKKVDEIIKTYTMISEVASGSYGTIYIRDDEDKNHNRRQCVWRLNQNQGEILWQNG